MKRLFPLVIILLLPVMAVSLTGPSYDFIAKVGGNRPPIVPVTAFGATADDGTDDYTAIMAAWASASANGGCLYFPAGEYHTSQELTLLPGTSSAKGGTANILGDGGQSSIITATGTWSGGTSIMHVEAATAAIYLHAKINGIGFNGNEKNCHGLTLGKAYDNTVLQDIHIDYIKGDHSALRMIPAVYNTNTSIGSVSQTITAIGIIAYHRDATATAPTIYLERLQECVFIECKAWGAKFASAPCDIWYMENCQSVSFINCSGMRSTTNVWHSQNTNASYYGNTWYNCLFEDFSTPIKWSSNGASYTYPHYYNAVHAPRCLTQAVGGTFDMEAARYGTFETGNSRGFQIGPNAEYITLWPSAETTVTNLGPAGTNNIFQWSTSSTAGNQWQIPGSIDMRTLRYPFIRFVASETTAGFWHLYWNASGTTDNGFGVRWYDSASGTDRTMADILDDDGPWTFRALDGSSLVDLATFYRPASGATSLYLRSVIGGVASTVPVMLGAPDSGGTGTRVLTIPNSF